MTNQKDPFNLLNKLSKKQNLILKIIFLQYYPYIHSQTKTELHLLKNYSVTN